jgi:hypothetical protein
MTKLTLESRRDDGRTGTNRPHLSPEGFTSRQKNRDYFAPADSRGFSSQSPLQAITAIERTMKLKGWRLKIAHVMASALSGAMDVSPALQRGESESSN